VRRAAALALCAALAWLALPPPREAGAVAFSVTCTASSTTLLFDNYEPLSGLPTTTPSGSISVTCTGSGINKSASPVTVSYDLQLDTSTARLLVDGANALTYDLCVNNPPFPTCNPWNMTGNRISGTMQLTTANQAAGVTNNHAYYGVIAASQNDPPGTYAESGRAITLNWTCSPAPTGSGAC
jgi:spore coat protein U-like protein